MPLGPNLPGLSLAITSGSTLYLALMSLSVPPCFTVIVCVSPPGGTTLLGPGGFTLSGPGGFTLSGPGGLGLNGLSKSGTSVLAIALPAPASALAPSAIPTGRVARPAAVLNCSPCIKPSIIFIAPSASTGAAPLVSKPVSTPATPQKNLLVVG